MSDDEYFVFAEPRPTMDVHEDDDTFRPRPTGVLNAAGEMIYRRPHLDRLAREQYALFAYCPGAARMMPWKGEAIRPEPPGDGA